MPPDSLIENYSTTRKRSLADCASLELEDYALQAAEFASPPKWHLAHTTWFYETFILKPFAKGYTAPNPQYEVLFNSYYNGIGEQHPRDQRGLLSRPLLKDVLAYRERVDDEMLALLDEDDCTDEVRERTVLGIEHERQHQELLFTDIKYSLAANPLYPAFLSSDMARPESGEPGEPGWDSFEGGLREIGAEGDAFAFDNEFPRHRVYLEDFEIASQLVSNAQYQAFIDDGGYDRAELWLADGWAEVCAGGWRAPLHWIERDGEALEFTLHGLRLRDAHQPVCHVSGYEADAFARWAGARLPTEAEWEHAAVHFDAPAVGREHLRALQPVAPENEDRQYFGACWQWMQSAYGPYPGYRASPGAIGEYNGKFMSNQWVLRGGSCVTWSSQARSSYRNFFYPQDRWQFSGIRLAR